MSVRKRVLGVLVLAAAAPLGGCSAVGGLVGGLAGGIGSLASILISLAAVAAPLALSYWLYTREKD